MQSKKQFNTMLTRTALLFIMTALPFLTEGCAVKIQDGQFCSPIPGDFGATCDNLLTSNQKILSQQEWLDLQSQWTQAGEATECTRSGTIATLKGEIEKLCSSTPCDYATKKALLDGLDKIKNLGVSPSPSPNSSP